MANSRRRLKNHEYQGYDRRRAGIGRDRRVSEFAEQKQDQQDHQHDADDAHAAVSEAITTSRRTGR